MRIAETVMKQEHYKYLNMKSKSMSLETATENSNQSIISKYQRNVDDIKERILSFYATGMSIRDIKKQIKGLYDVEISERHVSKISERILPEVKQWQDRPLEAYYPLVFIDAIHYKIREDHQVVTKAAYVILGIKLVLGLWVGASELPNTG